MQSFVLEKRRCSGVLSHQSHSCAGALSSLWADVPLVFEVAVFFFLLSYLMTLDVCVTRWVQLTGFITGRARAPLRTPRVCGSSNSGGLVLGTSLVLWFFKVRNLLHWRG